MSTTPTFIYLIEAQNGLVKIGIGQKVRDRYQATRLHSPILTRLIACWPGAQIDEDALHERFRAFREHGEWFALRGEFAAFVERSRGLGVSSIPAWVELKFDNRPAYRSRRNSERRKVLPRFDGAQSGQIVRSVTPKQAKALAFIREYISKHGCAPSYQEIGDAMGIVSKSGVHRLVHGLVERGHLSLLPGHWRTITLAERAPAAPSFGATA